MLVQNVAAGDGRKSGLGGFDPDEDPRWTVVTNVPNAIIGNLIKSQLEDAGIPVFMQRSPSADIAFFSHNDYVPHDLRVPFKMVEDARRLLDSGPDHSPGAPYRGTEFGYEDEDWAETEQPPYTPLGGPPSNLPEGWTLLPTERDLHAGRHYRPAHSDAEGWYRPDTSGGSTFGKGARLPNSRSMTSMKSPWRPTRLASPAPMSASTTTSNMARPSARSGSGSFTASCCWL